MKLYVESLNQEIVLSVKEVEKVYRVREHEYRLMDAKIHLDDVAENPIDERKLDSLLENIVAEYEDLFDCNVAENETWERAVRNVLSALS